MVILNLPEEPNTPAGKAIQTAQAPTAEQLSSKTTPNKFQVVFKSNPHLGDCINDVILDMGRKELVFTAVENGKYEWIDWILEVPEDEVITLFFLDDKNRHRCVLIMEEIYMFEHVCEIQNSEFQVNYENNLEHKITIQFAQIERVHPEGKS